MLMIVLFHGFMGMRIVVARLRPAAALRTFSLMAALRPGAILLFVIGTIVVVTLPNVVPARLDDPQTTTRSSSVPAAPACGPRSSSPRPASTRRS